MTTIKTAVDIDIKVDGQTSVQQAATAYEDLGDAVAKTQLRAEELAHQFGINDARTQEAIKVAARYKQEMEELDFAIEGARGGTETLFRASQAVVGGFEAAAGAAALFGSDSAELEKILVKVQGAMVFSQGLKDLKEFAPAVKQLGTQFKNLIPTLRTTSGLLKGLGIGALIGLVITFKDKILDLLGPLKGLVQSLTDWIGLTSEAERTMESAYLAAEKQADAIQRQIDLRTAQGASEEDLYKLQKQLAEKQLEMANNMAAEDDEQRKEKEKAILDANNRIAVVEAEHQTHLREIREEARLKELEERQAAEESFNELMAQVNEDAAQEIRNQAQRDAFERNKQITEQEKEALRIVNEATEKGILTQEQASAETTKIVDLANKRRLESDKQYLTDKRNMLMEQRELEIKTAQDIAQGLLSINELFAGKEAKSQEAAFKRAKALNISVATMDTFVGAQRAYNSQLTLTPDAPIRAAIAAAAAVAAGLARIKQIASQQFSASSPAASVSGATGITAPTRTFQASALGQDFTGDRRVYVTEGDITKTQRRVQNLQRVSVVGG
jgi:hypothetical protein